ncbi:MAG TPA: hypothetical protein VLW06_14460 [Terriglobales bacterium]|nr:hypothetical protein [Terriglobales bacterium]
MRHRTVLLAFLALATLAPAKTPDPCATVALPAKVRQLLHDKYRDWRPKTTTDLDEDDQRTYFQEYPHSCPGIAIGHFEEPDQRSYAIFLVPKTGVENRYKIVVFAQGEGSAEYHVSILDHGPSTPNSGVVISKVLPGKQTGFDETKSVALKLDGVNVEWLEKSSVLYYYSRGKYHSLQTSD